jgi:hypothetical protein
MVHPLNSRPSAFWTLNDSKNRRRPYRHHKAEAKRSMVAAFVALFLIVFGTLVGSRYQTAQNHSAMPGIVTGTLRVPMTVQRGDSFWSLAKRYGDPNAYILDRVDVLAQANKMSATASLMPGQRIVIPVSNPIEVARLQRNLAKN